MASRHLASSDKDERAHALQLLQAAIAERGRALEARESAGGTRDELEVSASVRAADEEVGARERWLEAVDDHDY
jgi:hypothetical protein